MSAIKIILVVIILYLIYTSYYSHSSFVSTSQPKPLMQHHAPPAAPVRRTNSDLASQQPSVTWNDKLVKEELTVEDINRHKKDMDSQAPMFSTGAGYSIVEEDSTHPAFTQFYGLNRPSYVPILPDQRQITDIDVTQFKKNKRVSWT
jgi:hypothetical protein